MHRAATHQTSHRAKRPQARVEISDTRFSPTDKRLVIIGARVSHELNDFLVAHAERCGLTRSELVDSLLRQYAQRACGEQGLRARPICSALTQALAEANTAEADGRIDDQERPRITAPLVRALDGTWSTRR